MATHALSKCMEKDCSKPPSHEILWANGKGHCWFCRTHLLSWVRKQMPSNTKKHEPDIQSIKVAVKGQASRHWRDNKTSDVKDTVLKALGDTNLSRGYSDPPLSKCMEKDCSKPPTHEVLWAEGMGHCWFCRPHLISWVKKHVKESKKEGWGLAIDYIRVVVNNRASARFRDNKTPDVLVQILKGIGNVKTA